MLSRDHFLQAAGIIRRAKHIIATIHVSPDGDAWGSLSAFSQFLEALGKSYQLYSQDELADNFLSVVQLKNLTHDPASLDWQAADLVVTLDCASPERCGLALLERPATCRWLEIDHHPVLKTSADFSLRDTKAAATCELVRDLALTAGWSISPIAAKSLLLGLVTDTGNFTYSSTSSHCLAAAASLCSAGASLQRVSAYGLGSLSLESLHFWGLALERLELFEPGVAVSFLLSDDFGSLDHEPDLDGLSGFLSVTKEAIAFLLLKQTSPGLIKGSWRSVPDGPDVSAIARVLGGGGHARAAGFSLTADLGYQNGQLYFYFSDKPALALEDWLKKLF